MKVSITKESKKFLTLEEAPAARQMIRDLKEDTGLAEYAKLTANFVASYFEKYGHCEEVLKATAEIAKNRRVWNYYNDDSWSLDVWVRITARTFNNFYIIGVYLSDIFSIGPSDRDDEIISHMYIRKFDEVK